MTYEGDIREIVQRHIQERERRMRKKMLVAMALMMAGIALAAWASWRAQ